MNKRIGDKYVNQMYSGTECIMDISDVTVDATQVLAGEGNNYFYLANGDRVLGTCDYDSNTTDADAMVSEILNGKTAYVNKTKLTGTMPNHGQATIPLYAPSEGAEIAVGNGYYANGAKMVVSGLTAAEIKAGVTYFGVTGTLSPEMPTEHGSATVLYQNQKVYEPTAGSLFDQFTVFGLNDILTTEENPQGGITYTIAVSQNP